MDSVIRTGRCIMRRVAEGDAVQFAPYMREREVEELRAFSQDSSILPVAMLLDISLGNSVKAFSVVAPDGMVVCMGGVCRIKNNREVSCNMSLLSGRGGYLWQVSRPEASEYKFEIVRRVAPAYLREVKQGFDFLTWWAPDFMVEMLKMVRLHGFVPVEQSGYNGCRFLRMEWRR